MKFSLLCEVDSKIEILKEIKVNYKGKEFFFIPDENKILSHLKIVAEVNNPEKFFSVVKETPTEKVKAHITINRDKELYDDLISDFQELESILAFSGNLTKIKWNEPKDEVICESEEEKQKAQLFRSHWKKEYPDPIKIIDEKGLKEIIESKEKFRSLTNPKAFWREANNDFKAFRYINAFFNFYFILEGLYGNGKTKNSAIEKEMLNSKEFLELIGWIIESIKKEKRHLKKIEEILKLRNKNLNAEGLTHLLVSTRGDLHHFVNNPNKVQGTPFNHLEFESIAWVTLGLATHAIARKIVEINLSDFKIEETVKK